MRVRFIILLAITATLSGCGLKRNLELPGHEKHAVKSDQTQQTTPPASTTDGNVAPLNAPAAVPGTAASPELPPLPPTP